MIMMLPVPPAGRRLRPGARGGGGGSPNGCGVPSQRPSPPTVTRTGPGDRDSAAGDPISLAGSVESASLSQPGSCGRVVSARAQPEAADRGSAAGLSLRRRRRGGPPVTNLIMMGGIMALAGAAPGRLRRRRRTATVTVTSLAPRALVNPAGHRPSRGWVVTAVHS